MDVAFVVHPLRLTEPRSAAHVVSILVKADSPPSNSGQTGAPQKTAASPFRKIPHLRWWIVGMLFFASVLNYIDRQNLSILARTIQDDLKITDMQYARVVQAFLFAYTVMFIFAGRITDWLGTRVSLAAFVIWWSFANMLTAFSTSVFSLGIFRFLLGVGEPGNYTAAPKAVSEWMLPKERGLAVGIYTAGATLGATIAPLLIAFLALNYGWRMTFVITGAMGFLWVLPWLWLYRPPEKHPRITPSELKLIQENVPEEKSSLPKQSEWQRWKELLARRETWLLLIARFLTDPVWFFYLFWFPKYLTDARDLKLLELGKVGWVVYLAADVGAILGGFASGYLIKRGMRSVPARKRIMIIAAFLIPLSPLVAFVPSVPLALFIAGVIAFAHMSWLVTMGAMIVDLFPKRSVATVFGIIAAGTGLGGLLSQEIVGRLVTNFSYTPVFILMGLAHPIALLLIRAIREPDGKPRMDTKKHE